MTQNVFASAADRIDDVDPDIRHFTDSINGSYAAIKGLANMSLPERRAVVERVRAPWTEGGPRMAETRELAILGMRARLHRPIAEGKIPLLFYIHGGGWTMFSIDTHDRLMREYAARAGVAVIGIDYSLSPEHRFPVALDEIGAAIGVLYAEAADMGINMDRFAIGGDSAGANLAVATTLALRDGGKALPRALMLSYGVFKSAATPSYARYSDARYNLGADEMDWFWANYVNNPSDHSNPLVEPIKAELTGLPPVFVAIPECDILSDGNHEFVAALKEADVPVEHVVYHGATHSFLEAVSISPLADRALGHQAAWLGTQLVAADD